MIPEHLRISIAIIVGDTLAQSISDFLLLEKQDSYRSKIPTIQTPINEQKSVNGVWEL